MRHAARAVRLPPVTFRQQIGPGASAKQIQQLLALLKDAGYADFRSARGPYGLTQRQGLGKFTNAEAEGIIERLEREAAEVGIQELVAPASPPPAVRRPLQGASTEDLVAELRHRGWTASSSS